MRHGLCADLQLIQEANHYYTLVRMFPQSRSSPLPFFPDSSSPHTAAVFCGTVPEVYDANVGTGAQRINFCSCFLSQRILALTRLRPALCRVP